MADPFKAVSQNVTGDFFVDSTCIDCDACRQIAPRVFDQGPETSFVAWQPVDTSERRDAMRALLSCPTGSIGYRGHDDRKSVLADFPLPIAGAVSYCGFNSLKSYGGNSYFIRHPRGNWLVDSPKFVKPLVKRLEALGGVKYVFLTHSDDVADAEHFARHFGAERIIHRRELESQPGAEIVIDGLDPVSFAPDFQIIPTPGHTAGHCCLLFQNRFLFTGDHLAWCRDNSRLHAHREYCWSSWQDQSRSMRLLSEFSFEWILPGHGQRIELPRAVMARHMADLLTRMSPAARDDDPAAAVPQSDPEITPIVL